MLPWDLGEVLVWLPFAAMAWAPLSVYTGTGDPRLLLAAQALWATVLWGLARHLWWRSRQKAVIYGGLGRGHAGRARPERGGRRTARRTRSPCGGWRPTST